MKKIRSTGFKVALVIVFLVLAIAATIGWFYGAIKSKTIFINEWFITDNAVRGVDLSNHQAHVDMRQLAAQNVKFVYMKATEGGTYVDNYFADNWQNAKDAGLARGAYHFFSFDSTGAEQAQNFINTVGNDLTGDLTPVIDVELHGKYELAPPSKEDVVREVKVMSDALEAQYGVKPLIYAQRDLYDLYLKGSFDENPRWVRSIYFPARWENGDNWLIWQYKDRGELAGYSGGEKYIDLDVLNPNRTLEDLTIK